MINDIEVRARRFSKPPEDPTPSVDGTTSPRIRLGPAPSLSDFPLRVCNKIRFPDLDRQGHVNNSVFSTLLEAGRVDLLYDPAAPLMEPGSAFVIVRLVLDFRGEVLWPGSVWTGTRITSIGRSSVKMQQALFQETRCVATADIVLVLMDDKTRRSRPLASFAVERFSELMTAAPAAM